MYSYRHRPESITKTAFSPKKLAWVKHCEQNLTWIIEHYPEYRKHALTRYASSILWALREIALSKSDYKEYVYGLKKKIKDEYKDFCACGLDKKSRIRLIMNRYFPFSIYKRAEIFVFHRSKNFKQESTDEKDKR